MHQDRCTSGRERTEHPHVELAPDGTAYVSGTMILVSRLWHWHARGVSAETLFRRYPSVRPAKILDALSYAHDHEESMLEEAERVRAVLARAQAEQERKAS